jgi:phosphohistidine phosphatase
MSVAGPGGLTVRLLLVQHGDALPKEVDPDRALSARGRADVERVAAFLGRAGVRVGSVLHSGKTRARQTAEILAAAVAAGKPIEARGAMDPLDPPRPVAEWIAGSSQDAMLVGHLPFMAKLASRLIAGSENANALLFSPGCVACLERTEEKGWTLAWMIRPELLRE